MSPDTRFVLLLVLFLGVLVLCTKPLGSYIADIMEGRPNFAMRLGGRFEALIYRICGIEPGREMAWSEYAIALLLFNVLGGVLLYALLRLQAFLPLNPQKFPGVGEDTAFNTAVSFITNTNWQSYSGESAIGYLAQMAGLAVQNFLSAATGIAVAIALIRGFARHGFEDHRQFLGGSHAFVPSTCCCRCPCCSPRAREPGRHAEFDGLQGRRHRSRN